MKSLEIPVRNLGDSPTDQSVIIVADETELLAVKTIFLSEGTIAIVGTDCSIYRLSNSVWLAQTSSGMISVKSFGAIGDGENDDTLAFVSALASKRKVFVPYGDYKVLGGLTISEGGFIGEGWGTENGAKRSRIVFYNLPDADSAAIKTTRAAQKGGYVFLENIVVSASSWDGVTGACGYGLDIAAKIVCRNVLVERFKSDGVFIHAGEDDNGPYESLFENLFCSSNGKHGIHVASGASSITFINLTSFWNGATAWGVVPVAPGNYDGIYIEAEVAPYPNTVPQSVRIYGGDCSYNSRYGWHFFQLTQSTMFPGYGEGNLIATGYQARVGGGISNCSIYFNGLGGNGLLNEATLAEALPTNVFKVNSIPSFSDRHNYEISGRDSDCFTILGDNGAGDSILYRNKSTPDGQPAGVNMYGSFRGFGSYAFALGSGSRHLKIADEMVKLPDMTYRGKTAAWDSATIREMQADAIPVAGNYNVGDRIWYNTPVAGGKIGAVCTNAGAPGTWKEFGAISA